MPVKSGNVPGGTALGGSRLGHTGMSPNRPTRGSRSSAGCRWSSPTPPGSACSGGRSTGRRCRAARVLPVWPMSQANAAARLKLLRLIGNRAVGRKPRVVQERREGGGFRIDRVRHDLRVPPEAVVDRQSVASLPLVLDEQRELLVVDIRRAGRVARDAVGAAALQVEQQRPAASSWFRRDTSLAL